MKNTCFFLLLIILILCVSFHSNAQFITTIAGNGISGYSGDGGAATLAQLQYPNGVIVDGAGNIFIADRQNNRVRKVDVMGVITTFAGTGTSGYGGDGGPASSAMFSNPIDVAFDGAGNLYVSDEGNSRIRKIDLSGVISTIAGNGIGGFSGDGGAATAAQLNTPWGITVDGPGNIYIADESNERVRKVNVSGVISTIAGTGIGGYTGDGVSATASGLDNPADIAVDGAGNVYITEYSNNRVRKVNTIGIISTIAGNGIAAYSGDGAAASLAQVNNPIGIAIDPLGNIFIGDGRNNRVRMINYSGVISTIAGTGTAGFAGDGGPATAANFNYVYNLALDVLNNIYVGDASNNRIRRFPGPPLPPRFAGGDSLVLSLCQNALTDSIDSLLSVLDVATGLSDTISLISMPVHGIAVAGYITISTGSILIPSGLSYTPTAGYSGLDSFKVRVANIVGADTTTVYVTVIPLPNAGTITGVDSVCPGYTVTLTDTAGGGGGTWSSSNTAISTVSGTGVVTGVTSGYDTIRYTVTTLGCSSVAIRRFKVRTVADCSVGIAKVINKPDGTLMVFPNPNGGMFLIKLLSPANEEVHFIITNMTGQKMKEVAGITNKQTEIKFDLAVGIYFITATTTHSHYVAKMQVE